MSDCQCSWSKPAQSSPPCCTHLGPCDVCKEELKNISEIKSDLDSIDYEDQIYSKNRMDEIFYKSFTNNFYNYKSEETSPQIQAVHHLMDEQSEVDDNFYKTFTDESYHYKHYCIHGSSCQEDLDCGCSWPCDKSEIYENANFLSLRAEFPRHQETPQPSGYPQREGLPRHQLRHREGGQRQEPLQRQLSHREEGGRGGERRRQDP